MKKIIVLVLAFAIILSVSACSNKSEKVEQSKDEEVIEEHVSEAKLAFNPENLDSILKHVTKVVLIEGATYKETVLKNHFPIPKTHYNVKRLKVIDKQAKDYDSLVKSLEPNEKNLKVLVYGGIVTKAQWYENLRDELKDKSAGREYVAKPVGKEAKKKIKSYVKEYVELEGNKIYLLLSSSVKTDDYNVGAYRVFEYDKKTETFYNQFSKLRFTLDELVSKLK